MTKLSITSTILSLVALFSAPVLADTGLDSQEGSRVVLAQTNNPQNIRLNGKSLNYCVLVLSDGVTSFDNKKTKFISVGIGNNKENLEYRTLFRIDKNGDYVRRWYYPDSDLIANRLTKASVDYGYSFDANLNEIRFTNGSNCMDREYFKLKIANGDLGSVSLVEWANGMCPSGRFVLGIPAFLASAETTGNDLKCSFENQ